MTIREEFSDPYPRNTFGVITGTYLLSRLPNIPGKLFRLQARGANAGSIFIGDGLATGGFPMPWQLTAGYDTGWFSADNLNNFYQRGSSGSSYISYWVQG